MSWTDIKTDVTFWCEHAAARKTRGHTDCETGSITLAVRDTTVVVDGDLPKDWTVDVDAEGIRCPACSRAAARKRAKAVRS